MATKYVNNAASKLAFAVMVVTVLVTTNYVNAKIDCNQITMLLTPCIPYGVMGGTVPSLCCDGIKKSVALIKTDQDLRDKCTCVQSRAAMIPGLNYNRVNELPALCHTTSPYIVSPKTNCSSLHLNGGS